MKTILQKSLLKLFTIMALMSICNSWAQVTLPHLDAINYTAATALQTQTGWTALNSGDDIVVASGSLSYTGLFGSSGNKLKFDGGGIDAAKAFTAQTTGTVYYSFLLNVTALGSLNTTGGYFTGFADSSTNFCSTVWLRSDGAGYDIGIAPKTTVGTVAWSSGTTAINNTVLVVVAYQVVAGATNDIAKIWINPTPGSTEPAPTNSVTNAATDQASLSRLLLRQDSATTTPFVEMDELRVGLTWASVTPAPAGSTNVSVTSLTDFGSANVGTTTASQSFTVDGTGLGANNVVVTAPANFKVSTDNSTWVPSLNLTPTAGTLSTTTVYAVFSPTSAGAKSGDITVATLNASTKNVSVSGTGVAVFDSASDIIENVSFVYPTNIAYGNYQSATITDLNSLEVASFTIADGGATADSDTSSTELNSISFSLSNFANIRSVALYDGTTKLGEVAPAATISFSGLTLTAADDATKDFSLRVTFNTTVTDKQHFQFAITAATANTAGSTFAAANAGGATSSISGGNNRIEVTASQLVYNVNAITTNINTAMTPAVKISAIDANNNLDTDFVDVVNITSTGTLTGAPVGVNAVAGIATFSTLTHTAGGLGLHLTAASGVLPTVDSATFDILNPIFTNPITGTNPNTDNPYTTGQTKDANITVSGVGRGTGIVGTAASNRYNANSWDTPAFDATQYFEFKMTPNAGYEIDLTSLILSTQISTTGPTNFALRSSVDGFVSNIGTITSATTATTLNINLTAAAYQQIISEVTFRVYAWGATGTSSTFSINDFAFNGNVILSTVASLSKSVASVTNLNYFEGSGPSASKTFTISGANLSPAAGDVTVTAPANFEVSADNVTFANTALVAYTGGTITNAPVYVRSVSGLTVGTYNGTITISGGTATAITVDVQGIIRLPFAIPYTNAFRTQTNHDDAVALGFTVSNTVFNASGYEQISNGGYIETPTINFTQHNTVQVTFSAAQFGGSTGQVLEFQISTDDGANYTTLGTVTPTSSTTYSVLKTNIDFASYPTTTGKLRILMTAGTTTTRFRDFSILNTTTWNGTAWSNGTPNQNTVAYIDGNYNTTTNSSINAKNLTVLSGNVIVSPNTNITLQDEIAVNAGTVTVKSNGNFIQVNTATNTGNITVERETTMRRLDYTYWSSPVFGQILYDFSPLTTVASATTTSRFYTFDETTNAFVNSFDPAQTTFAVGRGYSVRAPNTFTTTPALFTGTFTGVPNNGTKNVTVTRNNLGYNLIGNPYPSPISAAAFAVANPNIGTLYFWTHATQGGAAGSNYATFNGTGTVAPAGGMTPNGIIQTGQAFLINVPAAPVTTSVVFNNTMRVDDHQNQFFKTNQGTTEKSRIWLNLSNATTALGQMLVGYVDGATNELDVQFDGKMFGNTGSALYNVINNEEYVIQGKALPFIDSDVVALGFKATEAGNFSIALDHADGLFAADQAVFIKDNVTGTVHNIKQDAYTFASTAGTFNSRFEVVYSSPLATQNPVFNANSVIVYKNNGSININAGAVVMKNVKIFDIQGRLLAERNPDATTMQINNANLAQQVLIIQVTAADNKTASIKFVN